MASSSTLCSRGSVPALPCSTKFDRIQSLPHFNSQTVFSNSIFSLKQRSLPSRFQIRRLKTQRTVSRPVVVAAKFDFVKVLGTVVNVGKDGIEAGTNLVPESVPRPVARISVTVVALTVSLFVLKSFVSTAFFVLGTMGLAYFLFIALNKDKSSKPRGGSSSRSSSGSDSIDDPLEEARKIMEKYK